MAVTLQKTKGAKRKLEIQFRAFNDGVALRYIFPEQGISDSIFIMNECTEFVLASDGNSWWIPAYRDNRYEYLYEKTKVSEIDTVHTPFTIQSDNGLYLSIQMLADLPDNYDGNPSFQFLKDVPVDWDDTKVINGEIGEYITTVRKDRKSEDWYLGSMTKEKSREFTVSLDFLGEGKYEAQIYADAPGTTWQNEPEKVAITAVQIDKNSTLPIVLGEGSEIQKTAMIETGVVIKKPAIIGKHCFTGANAYFREGVYLDSSVKIGPGCEIKSSIICSETAVAHFNYIGNSIIGRNVNFEAGAIAANHYNERISKEISVLYKSEIIKTNTRKF